ncbi:MAG: DUF1573 domain-containing protein [Chitinophagaceae bacterium]|nr:DUF1573 domain-containing protein [Chitinophagaceae bacterium]
MKYLSFITILLFFGYVSFGQTSSPVVLQNQASNTSGPSIQFLVSEYDFKDIAEGELANCTFEFVNNGTAPLIVNEVQPSCGCTIPEWSKEPIAPKGKGTIKAQYNTINRPGSFKKALTVLSNSANSPNMIIYIKGNVIPKPKN